MLTYILLSISVWVKGVETSERAFSEFYKESTIELAIEQITPSRMDNVTYTIMDRSLYRLNEHSVEFTVNEGPVDDEMQNVRSAMFELLMNGSADSAYFNGAGISQEENSSLTAWASNLNASLLAIGVYLSDFEVNNFEISQNDKAIVNYSFDITLQIKDLSNTSAVSRLYLISNELNITGLVDPALARKTKSEAGDNLTAYRMFFFHEDYPDSSSISVTQLPQSIEGGQGWLYAPLALANGSADLVPEYHTIAPSYRYRYILVGTFEEIASLTPDIYEDFGGYILTDSATVTVGVCGEEEDDTFNPIEYSIVCESFLGTPYTGKPFIVAPGFNPEIAPECPLLDGSNTTRRCALMLNAYSQEQVSNDPQRKLNTGGSGLFALEEMRDFVMCGYYTHNPVAPSYLQRLLDDSYERNNSAYGIETFVIGNYANDYSVYDVTSRLDRELFDVAGIKIRGMPGCKDFSMCSDEPMTGIFAVSTETQVDYGLEDLACNNGAAGCD